MKHSGLIALTFALTSATVAFADDGLYEDVFDPSSSFVRVVAPGQSTVSIDGTTIRDLEGGVSGYVNVMPGAIDVVMPGGNTELEAGVSTHYTLILDEDGTFSVIEDAIAKSPAKADISLYNLTDADGVDLFVPAANAPAMQDIAPLQSQTVAVRAPLTLDFEVRAGEDILTELSDISLERGAGVSIVLTETDAGYVAVATTNTYLR